MAGVVYELVDHALFGNQEVLTRYYYWDPSGVLAAGDLNTDYQADVLPKLAACQVQEVIHDYIIIRQVYPSLALGIQFDVNPNVPGTITNAPAATTTTYSCQLVPGPTTTPDSVPATPYIKRGGKHIAGVDATAIGSDGGYNGTTDVPLTAYLASLVGTLTSGGICVIAHRPSGGVVDKLAPVAAGIIHNLGTQANRKIGRGA